MAISPFTSSPAPAQEKYRISKTTGVFMLIVAAGFDLIQAAAKILILIGLTLLAGAAGAYVGNLVGSTAIGAFVGSAVGAVASATGIGTAAAFAVGFTMNLVFSWAAAIAGYSTMGLWFSLRGVSVFGGSRMTRKVTTMFASFLIDITPLLNLLPGLTTWTFFMIHASREEDKEQARTARPVYNLNTKRLRSPRRPANDNVRDAAHEREYADAA